MTIATLDLTQRGSPGDTDPIKEKSLNDNSSKSLPQRSFTPAEELVLFALHGKRLFGVQIREAVRQASDGRRDLPLGTIHPTLAKLERRQLVSSSPDPSHGKRRKYYLTKRGEDVIAALQQFLQRLLSYQPD